MEDKFYVYEWIRLDTNDCFYVGKGRGNRCYEMKRNRSKHFQNIVNKTPCAVIILEDNLFEKEAFEFEVFYIWLRRDIEDHSLVNNTDGGEGIAGYRFTIDQRNNISKNHGMHKKENRLKISKAMKGKMVGEKHPMFGKKGEANPNYGRKNSKEVKEKMSRNSAKYWLGKTFSEETRKKISENNAKSASRPIILFKDNLEIGKFNSIHDASKWLENIIGGSLASGIKSLAYGWIPSRGQLKNYTAKFIN